MFSTFSTVTEDQVTKVITNSPSKSCSLDPWPTFLVLDYLDILITPITAIINASLEQGKCPNFFKQVHVTPILKKPSLDKEVFKNYRPVSNLNFISKILERVVSVQLQTHLDEAGLMTAFQSPYRKHHFTESALLNIQNDILLNMAKGSVTALTLLDLSTAFDTIDHTILLDRLNVYYGLSELTLSPENFCHSIQKLKNCLNDIQNFMLANKLKLNPDKTEFILIGSQKNRNQLLPHFPINILGNQVSPAQSVRNLGVVFNSNFTFSNHVSQVIQSTRVQARDLYRIHLLLDLNTSVLLANALVSSRLDYCNSLFLSLTDFELRRLQLVQNSLCRVVTRSSKFSHITPQLKKLHWLPVRYRVQFKIGLITYKILTQGQPVYLRGLIHPYTSFRNTRGSTPKLKFLQTPTFDRRVHKSIKHFSNSFSH